MNSQASTATPHNDDDKIKVLLVDDNDDIREVFGIGLDMLGFQIAQAATGTDAVKMFSKFNPDVVIVDQGLPDILGTEVGRQIRGMESSTRAAMAILTGTDGQALRDLAIEIGFDEFFVKPVKINTIAEWIQNVARKLD